jgi:hypothetical protein
MNSIYGRIKSSNVSPNRRRNLEKKQTDEKIEYVKPAILDLGPVTQVAFGASDCTEPGNSATINCGNGDSAGIVCLTGQNVGGT